MDLEFLKRHAENLAEFLGNDCEIAIHDFRNGFDATIVHIVNGHVSGRTVGCPPTNLFFERVLGREHGAADMPVYFTTLPDGRRIKSCTTFIRNEAGVPEGAMCINMDVTHLSEATEYLQSVLGQAPGDQGSEIYAKSLGEIVEHHLEAVEREIGVPATKMNREEKMRALSFLDERGVFQMVKANVRLCEFFGVSKFTLYNYLEEVRRDHSGGKTT